MKNILNKNLNLEGKKVLLRVDLNVPMKNGAITEISRIENNNTIFKKIIYNDKETNYDDLDITPFDKCFIKLYISNKTDSDMYERLMDRLYNHINLHAIDVIEDPTDIGASVREDILEQGEDTLTFLGNYIDQIDVKIDKQKLKAFAKELYMEAGE